MDERVANDKNNVSQVIPNVSLVCIEHPGRVRSSRNAMNTLGGDYMVDKVCRKYATKGVQALIDQ